LWLGRSNRSKIRFSEHTAPHGNVGRFCLQEFKHKGHKDHEGKQLPEDSPFETFVPFVLKKEYLCKNKHS